MLLSLQVRWLTKVFKALFEQAWKDDPVLPNATATKAPGRKPGFRAPVPRISAMFTSFRQTTNSSVPRLPVGKPPEPKIAPPLPPLSKRKPRPRKKIVPAKVPTPPLRRSQSPDFAEADGSDSEPDIPQSHLANEVESEALVTRLEDSIPLWNGPDSNLGWMSEPQVSIT